MTDWLPITELPEALKDGRPVLLWTDWSSARAQYPTSAAEGHWRDEPVAARWYRPGGGPNGYWSLTETGSGAYEDEVNGPVSHYAEIEPPK